MSRRKLFVNHMPLSWCEEGEKLPSGCRVKSQSVGRRVWGVNPGQAIYMIESGPCAGKLSDELVLRDMRDGGRIIQQWPREPGYDSPWGGDGWARLVQTAEWHEAHELNAWLDAIRASQEENWQEACKQMAKDCEP